MPQSAQARGIGSTSLERPATLVAADSVAAIVTRCDGAALLAALDAATARLAANVDEVNALNVYPVPDGDTGTNMLHTLRTAAEHVRKADPSLAARLAAMAHGSLMGARGNSGVILSQMLRGVKDACTGDALDPREAFSFARKLAFAAVTHPAPGTMLSALAEIDEAVQKTKGSVRHILQEAVRTGLGAVARTERENPTNRAAGVVDAGARGLLYVLDGALASLEGRAADEGMLSVAAEGGPWRSDSLRNSPAGARTTASARSNGPAGSTLARQSAEPAHIGHRVGSAPGPTDIPSWEGAYDVQFLIKDPTRPVEDIRSEMLEFGADCVLVVGDETVCKVHVHTLAPHEIIRIGLTAGRISDVVVEDLEAMTAEHEAATGIVVSPPREAAPIAVVTVVPGDGLARIAASLGAHVVRGGPTMNPSTEELLEEMGRANARRIVLLPNDKNVLLAAEQAARLFEGEVTVIPTRTVAQGMAALVTFDMSREPDEIVAAMRAAPEQARTIELTQAVRDATVDGRQVRKGEHMALFEGRVAAHGEDEVAALAEAAQGFGDPGLLTVYVGAGVIESRVTAVTDRLRAAFPKAEVEVVDGGQPHYPFIVASE